MYGTGYCCNGNYGRASVQQTYFIFMDSDDIVEWLTSSTWIGIEAVSGSTMELPSTDAAIPLSASSEMCVPEPAFVSHTAFNDTWCR